MSIYSTRPFLTWGKNGVRGDLLWVWVNVTIPLYLDNEEKIRNIRFRLKWNDGTQNSLPKKVKTRRRERRNNAMLMGNLGLVNKGCREVYKRDGWIAHTIDMGWQLEEKELRYWVCQSYSSDRTWEKREYKLMWHRGVNDTRYLKYSDICVLYDARGLTK